MFKRVLLRVFLMSIMGIITLMVLSFLGSVMLEHAHGINHVAQEISIHHIGWTVWRYSLMVVFIGLYPYLVRFVLTRCDDVSEILRDKYARRRYAILFCVFYELVLVHNALAWVISGLLHL